MGNKQTVLILEQNQKLLQKLRAEICAIGYIPAHSAFPDIKPAEILNLAPAAVIIGLSEWNNDIKSACATFMEKISLSDNFPVMALVSRHTIGKMPAEMAFSGIAVLPCTLQELDLRLARAISQYKQKGSRGTIVIDELSIDTSNCQVSIRQKHVALTFKEYELLKYLAANRGHVYTRLSLLNTIWGHSYYGGTRTVDVHIRRIRDKIGDTSQKYIRTVRGSGYSFRIKRSAAS